MKSEDGTFSVRSLQAAANEASLSVVPEVGRHVPPGN